MSKISRRYFLKYSTLGFGSVILTACGLKEIPIPTANPLPPTSPAAFQTSASLPTVAATAIGKGKKGKGQKPKGQNAKNTANVAPTHDTNITGKQILGRPTGQTITANVIPASDSKLYFEVGTAPGKYTFQTPTFSAPAGIPVNALIDNLQQNTQYYYRLHVREANKGDYSAGDEHTFVTQRAPGKPFVFTIDADPHNHDPNFNAELYDITLTNALHDHPDFHINLGDTFMTEKLSPRSLSDVVSSYTDMLPHFGIIAADAPLFLVNGNHEGELGWVLDGSDQNLAVWCTQTRQKYYPNPKPDKFYSGSASQEQFIGIRDGYYAWTWGDALFVALDPFWYTSSKPKPQTNGNWGWTLGKNQYDWLKQTLETSKARYKFIFIHNLLGGSDKDGRGGIEPAGYYEWGGKNQDGSLGFDQQRSGWGLPIHQLLVKNKVSALFHGHDHVFVKQDLDGIVYQECPQPSITRYDNTQLAQDYGYVHGDVVSSSGHLRVTVTTEKTTVEYVRAYLPQDETSTRHNGQVAYSYTMV